MINLSRGIAASAPDHDQPDSPSVLDLTGLTQPGVLVPEDPGLQGALVPPGGRALGDVPVPGDVKVLIGEIADVALLVLTAQRHLGEPSADTIVVLVHVVVLRIATNVFATTLGPETEIAGVLIGAELPERQLTLGMDFAAKKLIWIVGIGLEVLPMLEIVEYAVDQALMAGWIGGILVGMQPFLVEIDQ